MRPFALLSSLGCSRLYAWDILLCCCCLWAFIYAAALKKRLYGVFSAILFIFGFSILQVIKYVLDGAPVGRPHSLTEKAASLPVWCWCCALALLFAAALLLFLRLRFWRKSHITPMTLKDCGDGHPSAIVFWLENGRVLYSNAAAGHLSAAVTGSTLLNGNDFFAALGDSPVPLPDGTTWSYRHRTVLFDGKMLHELTAADTTELYKQTKQLEKDTARLQELNRDLRNYSAQIEELVRSQEVLNAKVSVHDEMNRLLMATGRAFAEGNTDEQTRLLNAWKNSTALLAHETDRGSRQNILEDLHTYGELLGIRFTCNAFPESADRDRMRFLVRLCREAMANAVKHASAQNINAQFSVVNESLRAEFTDDGPAFIGAAPAPAGGLLTLKEEAGRLGGTLYTEASPRYRLVAVIPKGDMIL